MSDSAAALHNNKYSSIITFDIVCSILATGFVCLRLYVRHHIVGKIRLDDWLLLIGTILFIISNALDAASWNVVRVGGVSALGLQNELGNIELFPYFLAEAFIRAAYAVFYLSVVPRELDLRWERWTITISFFIYALVMTVCAFITLFQCGNPANLASSDVNVVCIGDNVLLSFVYNAPYYFDAVLDWLMALIPVRIVWQSTMTMRNKMSVALILLLGCVASVLGVVVIPLALSETKQDRNTLDQNMGIKVDIIGTCETLVAIICLSLAALKPMFKKFIDHHRMSRSSGVDPSQDMSMNMNSRETGDNKDTLAQEINLIVHTIQIEEKKDGLV
ncbi:hypothetical protein K461DRAFT_325163 [Myriangium duriaei CBS 260.36]|uniref:Rhodopsin domain-containing protein n=1 Tax=Myriangium duriaei CBS 260.36 TaxID=1168546 RepID=A0A9P4IVN9_9PEZI|nr:hypothetical protein K461DRAFT_325163 [Myriangium duriaei CBS 260.36]